MGSHGKQEAIYEHVMAYVNGQNRQQTVGRGEYDVRTDVHDE